MKEKGLDKESFIDLEGEVRETLEIPSASSKIYQKIVFFQMMIFVALFAESDHQYDKSLQENASEEKLSSLDFEKYREKLFFAFKSGNCEQVFRNIIKIHDARRYLLEDELTVYSFCNLDLAKSYYFQAEYDVLEEFLEVIYVRKDHYGDLLFIKAKLAEKNGDLLNAIKHMEESRKVNPKRFPMLVSNFQYMDEMRDFIFEEKKSEE